MCKAFISIRFCSCPENLDLTKSAKDSNYIWILERAIGFGGGHELGITVLPSNNLEGLLPEFVLEELNSKNTFDFDYEPRANDKLRIERVDGRNTITSEVHSGREYYFGEHLDFHYNNGKWSKGVGLTFLYDLEDYKKGEIKLKKQVSTDYD